MDETCCAALRPLENTTARPIRLRRGDLLDRLSAIAARLRLSGIYPATNGRLRRWCRRIAWILGCWGKLHQPRFSGSNDHHCVGYQLSRSDRWPVCCCGWFESWFSGAARQQGQTAIKTSAPAALKSDRSESPSLERFLHRGSPPLLYPSLLINPVSVEKSRFTRRFFVPASVLVVRYVVQARFMQLPSVRLTYR